MNRIITLLSCWLLLSFVCTSVVFAQQVFTLEEALQQAEEQNYDIRIARNDVAIARADYSIGNAGFLPTVDASAGYTGTLSNTEQSFLSGQTNEVDGALTTRTSAGVNMNWSLFEGLGRNATLDRLKQEFEQQEQTEQSTKEAVIGDVILLYYDLVRQQEQRAVFEEAVTLSEERLRIAELRRDLGSASELEVRQAQLDLNTDRVNLLRQETTLSNAKASFNQLLVRPLNLDYAVEDTIPVGPIEALDVLNNQALAQNSLLRISEKDRMIAGIQIREIKSEWLPSLSASTGYNYSDLSAESGFLLSNQSTDFTYGLSLNLGLFDGFNRRRRLSNAMIRQSNADLVIESIRTQIESNVSRTYQNFLNSRQTVSIEQESVVLALQNVNTALERFELGDITSIELREVQEALTRARSLLLFAQYEAKQAEVELHRLTGRLLR
ncbi:MAG: TolC family protein [Rhodothermaceae bacterium]|nr:TolC family protein [Rhodothermaceae bacterium]